MGSRLARTWPWRWEPAFFIGSLGCGGAPEVRQAFVGAGSLSRYIAPTTSSAVLRCVKRCKRVRDTRNYTRGVLDYHPSAADWSIVVTQGQISPQGEHPRLGPKGPIELNDAPPSQSVTLSFGPFRLFPAARAFEKEGIPLPLGSRALDILMVLVERAGEVVSQRELIARVWRGLVVDPSNLRVHLTSLRRALGDRDGKERYIANVTGQGYCFVAPVRREAAAGRPTLAPEYPCGTARQRLVLPAVLARMVGREAAVRTICADLIADRFVTIIGPGGMGKTTVAVSVAAAMLEEFAGAVCFVDIGDITDPKLVATTIASKLGLTIQTDDVLPALMLCLRTLRILLVLDNCEHVIDASAALAERILQEAPGVHILATSREAMRVEGEHAYWLPPLESPPSDSGVNAADALKFPAVKLFLERTAASGCRFELSDADAPLVAGICERLDGMPLAIEFAAARVAAHGIAGTANLLKSRLGLHWPGRRTALPRHQTLHALFDWSYTLLTETERSVLRRLSIFVGLFTLEAAQAAAGEGGPVETLVVDAVDSLVAKSLVSAVVSHDSARYRLLEPIRVYAMEKLEASGEKQGTALRHAKYFASLLGRIDPRNRGARSLGEYLGNVRAALEWTVSDGETGSGSRGVGSTGALARDPILAINLTVGSVPIFLELSLLSECHKWSRAALLLLDDAMRGSRQEMVLQEAVAVSATWTGGNGDDVRAAIMRALEIAHSRGDTSTRLRLLAGLHMFHLRAADIRGSLAVAEELANAARTATEASYSVIAEWLLGCSHHFMGNQPAARQHLERGLACSGHLNAKLFGLDYRLRALIVLQRVLWLSGFPNRALEVAREAIREAEVSSNPVNICFSCLYTATVFLWCGELGTAHDVLEKLMTHPNWHALPVLHATAFALQGELLVRQGEVERGLALLQSALPMMRADRQTIQLARASCALAEGLAAAGQPEEALAVSANAIAETEAGSETSQFPELLRVQADILLSMPSTDEALAEAVLMRALAEARRQCALAWELRAAMTLARLRGRQGRSQEGRELVSSVYARFSEGFETRDLQAARKLVEASC
jgi:predicted ATPase/DNA-binding winged helix-turn-helix (wHTH) protein